MTALGSSLLVFGTLALITAILWMIVNRIRKRPQRRPLTTAVVAIACMIGGGIVFGDAMDQQARDLGYVDMAEMNAAKAAGIDTPDEYRAYAAKVEAEQERAAEEKKRAEQAAAAEAAAAEAAKERAKEAACRSDLGCWAEKHFVRASFACAAVVPRLAQYTHRWTDGTLEPKFSRYRWSDRAAGVVTYIGDRVEFQNGFGAWLSMIYTCDYDTGSGHVVDAQASAGRLPQ